MEFVIIKKHSLFLDLKTSLTNASYAEPGQSGRCSAYRSKTVAVQTVSMVIPLQPEVTVRDSNVSVLVAESPEEKELTM